MIPVVKLVTFGAIMAAPVLYFIGAMLLLPTLRDAYVNGMHDEAITFDTKYIEALYKFNNMMFIVSLIYLGYPVSIFVEVFAKILVDLYYGRSPHTIVV